MTTLGSPQAEVDTIEDELTRILDMQWEKASGFEPRLDAATGTEWVLLSWGPSKCADALATTLRDALPGSDVKRVDISTAPVPADSDGADQRHVFFLDETAPLTGSALAEDASWAWAHALVHTCQRVASRPGARLWIVTRTGLHGPGTRDVVRPEQDFAWALGRCHAAESPQSWGGLVDLDLDDPDAAARMLADYLLSGTAEDEILLRDDGPLLARLHASTLPPTASNQSLSMDGLHIVSGGAAGLSFEIERWLADQGARRLLVLGRTPLDGDRRRNVQALKASGCDVEYEVLDVGDPDAVDGLATRLRERGDSVAGVFHLASQWRLGGRSCVSSLSATTDEQTRVLLGAKAGGALLLGELAEDVGAEAMVLFSSAAATLGSPGQATYAAANAVLDGVARRLNRQGRVRAVSIAWGPVGEVGFGATPDGARLHDAWERLGLRRLTVEKVLSTIDMALSQDQPNLAVVSWNEQGPDPLPWAGARPVLEPLTASSSPPQGVSLRRLEALQEGRERVEFIVDVIREHLAQILSCSPEQVDPERSLAMMGVDSLIALEVLFVVEREFAVRIGLDEVLLGMDSTLTELAGMLDELIRKAAPAAPSVPASSALPQASGGAR